MEANEGEGELYGSCPALAQTAQNYQEQRTKQGLDDPLVQGLLHGLDLLSPTAIKKHELDRKRKRKKVIVIQAEDTAATVRDQYRSEDHRTRVSPGRQKKKRAKKNRAKKIAKPKGAQANELRKQNNASVAFGDVPPVYLDDISNGTGARYVDDIPQRCSSHEALTLDIPAEVIYRKHSWVLRSAIDISPWYTSVSARVVEHVIATQSKAASMSDQTSGVITFRFRHIGTEIEHHKKKGLAGASDDGNLFGLEYTLKLLQLFSATLEVLDLQNNCRVNDGLLQRLFCSTTTKQKSPPFPALRCLSVRENPQLTDYAVQCVVRSNSPLQFLDLEDCAGLTDKALVELEKIAGNLTFLNISGNGSFTDRGANRLLSLCKNLQYLSFERCPGIRADGIANILGSLSQRMRYLALRRAGGTKVNGPEPRPDIFLQDKITDAVFHLLVEKPVVYGYKRNPAFHFLSTVIIEDCNEISDLSLSYIAQSCKNLQALSLAGCKNVGEATGMRYLLGLEYLFELNLSRCSLVSDESVECLFEGEISMTADHHDLELQKADSIGISDPSLNGPLELSGLRLFRMLNPASPPGPHIWKSEFNIATLSSKRCVASSSDNPENQRKTNSDALKEALKTHVSDLKVKRRELWRLQGVLRTSSKRTPLVALNISRCGAVSDRAAEILSKKSLLFLSMSHCAGITEYGLSQLFCSTNSFQKLDLSGTGLGKLPLGSRGVKDQQEGGNISHGIAVSQRIAVALCQRSFNLISLDLSWCPLINGDIFLSLASLQFLLHLDLSYNRSFQEECFQDFPIVQLSHLYLRGVPNISDSAVLHLTMRCKKLMVLNVADNQQLDLGALFRLPWNSNEKILSIILEEKHYTGDQDKQVQGINTFTTTCSRGSNFLRPSSFCFESVLSVPTHKIFLPEEVDENIRLLYLVAMKENFMNVHLDSENVSPDTIVEDQSKSVTSANVEGSDESSSDCQKSGAEDVLRAVERQVSDHHASLKSLLDENNKLIEQREHAIVDSSTCRERHVNLLVERYSIIASGKLLRNTAYDGALRSLDSYLCGQRAALLLAKDFEEKEATKLQQFYRRSVRRRRLLMCVARLLRLRNSQPCSYNDKKASSKKQVTVAERAGPKTSVKRQLTQQVKLLCYSAFLGPFFRRWRRRLRVVRAEQMLRCWKEGNVRYYLSKWKEYVSISKEELRREKAAAIFLESNSLSTGFAWWRQVARRRSRRRTNLVAIFLCCVGLETMNSASQRISISKAERFRAKPFQRKLFDSWKTFSRIIEHLRRYLQTSKRQKIILARTTSFFVEKSLRFAFNIWRSKVTTVREYRRKLRYFQMWSSKGLAVSFQAWHTYTQRQKRNHEVQRKALKKLCNNIQWKALFAWKEYTDAMKSLRQRVLGMFSNNTLSHFFQRWLRFKNEMIENRRLKAAAWKKHREAAITIQRWWRATTFHGLIFNLKKIILVQNLWRRKKARKLHRDLRILKAIRAAKAREAEEEQMEREDLWSRREAVAVKAGKVLLRYLLTYSQKRQEQVLTEKESKKKFFAAQMLIKKQAGQNRAMREENLKRLRGEKNTLLEKLSPEEENGETGKVKGTEEYEAATIIQAHVRGRIVRRDVWARRRKERLKKNVREERIRLARIFRAFGIKHRSDQFKYALLLKRLGLNSDSFDWSFQSLRDHCTHDLQVIVDEVKDEILSRKELFFWRKDEEAAHLYEDERLLDGEEEDDKPSGVWNRIASKFKRQSQEEKKQQLLSHYRKKKQLAAGARRQTTSEKKQERISGRRKGQLLPSSAADLTTLQVGTRRGHRSERIENYRKRKRQLREQRWKAEGRDRDEEDAYGNDHLVAKGDAIIVTMYSSIYRGESGEVLNVRRFKKAEMLLLKLDCSGKCVYLPRIQEIYEGFRHKIIPSTKKVAKLDIKAPTRAQLPSNDVLEKLQKDAAETRNFQKRGHDIQNYFRGHLARLRTRERRRAFEEMKQYRSEKYTKLLRKMGWGTNLSLKGLEYPGCVYRSLVNEDAWEDTHEFFPRRVQESMYYPIEKYNQCKEVSRRIKNEREETQLQLKRVKEAERERAKEKIINASIKVDLETDSTSTTVTKKNDTLDIKSTTAFEQSASNPPREVESNFTAHEDALLQTQNPDEAVLHERGGSFRELTEFIRNAARRYKKQCERRRLQLSREGRIRGDEKTFSTMFLYLYEEVFPYLRLWQRELRIQELRNSSYAALQGVSFIPQGVWANAGNWSTIAHHRVIVKKAPQRPFTAYLPQGKLMIDLQPGSQVATEGGTFRLEVKAGGGVPPYRYQWLRKRKKKSRQKDNDTKAPDPNQAPSLKQALEEDDGISCWTRVPGATESLLLVDDVKKRHNALYVCRVMDSKHGEGKDGEIIYSAVAEVEVRPSLSVICNSATNIDATVSSTFTLKIHVEGGTPPYHYTWLKVDGLADDSPSGQAESPEEKRMADAVAAPYNNRTRKRVKDGGIRHENHSLMPPPRALPIFQANRYCMPEVVIPTASFMDGGRYYCAVRDCGGALKYSQAFRVEVHRPLFLSLSCHERFAGVGDQLKVTASVVGGIPPFTFSWYFQGKRIKRHSSNEEFAAEVVTYSRKDILQLRHLRLSDGGVYHCMVEDEGNGCSFSAPFTLSVLGDLKVTVEQGRNLLPPSSSDTRGTESFPMFVKVVLGSEEHRTTTTTKNLTNWNTCFTFKKLNTNDGCIEMYLQKRQKHAEIRMGKCKIPFKDFEDGRKHKRNLLFEIEDGMKRHLARLSISFELLRSRSSDMDLKQLQACLSPYYPGVGIPGAPLTDLGDMILSPDSDDSRSQSPAVTHLLDDNLSAIDQSNQADGISDEHTEPERAFAGERQDLIDSEIVSVLNDAKEYIVRSSANVSEPDDLNIKVVTEKQLSHIGDLDDSSSMAVPDLLMGQSNADEDGQQPYKGELHSIIDWTNQFTNKNLPHKVTIRKVDETLEDMVRYLVRIDKLDSTFETKSSAPSQSSPTTVSSLEATDKWALVAPTFRQTSSLMDYCSSHEYFKKYSQFGHPPRYAKIEYHVKQHFGENNVTLGYSSGDVYEGPFVSEVFPSPFEVKQELKHLNYRRDFNESSLYFSGKAFSKDIYERFLRVFCHEPGPTGMQEKRSDRSLRRKAARSSCFSSSSLMKATYENGGEREDASSSTKVQPTGEENVCSPMDASRMTAAAGPDWYSQSLCHWKTARGLVDFVLYPRALSHWGVWRSHLGWVYEGSNVDNHFRCLSLIEDEEREGSFAYFMQALRHVENFPGSGNERPLSATPQLGQTNDKQCALFKGFSMRRKMCGLFGVSNFQGEIYVGEVNMGLKHGRGRCYYPPRRVEESFGDNSSKQENEACKTRYSEVALETLLGSRKNSGQSKDETMAFEETCTGPQHHRDPSPNVELNDVHRDKSGSISSASLIDTHGGWYIGQFWKGERAGYGAFCSHSGAMYEGEWLNGLPHGTGVYIYGSLSPQGMCQEECLSKKDSPDKRSSTLLLTGLLKRLSQRCDGALSGVSSQGSSLLKLLDQHDELLSLPDAGIYSGEFYRGKRQGVGLELNQSGGMYEGNFYGDLHEGVGALLEPNGDVYQGGFVNNKRDGAGILTLKNGEEYSGRFIDGELDGNVVLKIYKNDRIEVYEGKWDRGVFIEWDKDMVSEKATTDFIQSFVFDTQEGDTSNAHSESNNSLDFEDVNNVHGRERMIEQESANGSISNEAEKRKSVYVDGAERVKGHSSSVDKSDPHNDLSRVNTSKKSKLKSLLPANASESDRHYFYRKAVLSETFRSPYAVIVAQSLPKLPRGVNAANHQVMFIVSVLIKVQKEVVGVTTEERTQVEKQSLEEELVGERLKLDAKHELLEEYKRRVQETQRILTECQKKITGEEEKMFQMKVEIFDFWEQNSKAIGEEFEESVKELNALTPRDWHLFFDYVFPPPLVERIVKIFLNLHLPIMQEWLDVYEWKHISENLCGDSEANFNSGDAYGKEREYRMKLLQLVKERDVLDVAKQSKVMDFLKEQLSDGSIAPDMPDVVDLGKAASAVTRYLRASFRYAQETEKTLPMHANMENYQNALESWKSRKKEKENELSRLEKETRQVAEDVERHVQIVQGLEDKIAKAAATLKEVQRLRDLGDLDDEDSSRYGQLETETDQIARECEYCIEHVIFTIDTAAKKEMQEENLKRSLNAPGEDENDSVNDADDNVKVPLNIMMIIREHITYYKEEFERALREQKSAQGVTDLVESLSQYDILKRRFQKQLATWVQERIEAELPESWYLQAIVAESLSDYAETLQDTQERFEQVSRACMERNLAAWEEYAFWKKHETETEDQCARLENVVAELSERKEVEDINSWMSTKKKNERLLASLFSMVDLLEEDAIRIASAVEEGEVKLVEGKIAVEDLVTLLEEKEKISEEHSAKLKQVDGMKIECERVDDEIKKLEGHFDVKAYFQAKNEYDELNAHRNYYKSHIKRIEADLARNKDFEENLWVANEASNTARTLEWLRSYLERAKRDLRADRAVQKKADNHAEPIMSSTSSNITKEQREESYFDWPLILVERMWDERYLFYCG